VDVRKRLDKALGTNFTVGDLVGRGGFAEVFSVRDNRLKRELAVKVLSPELVVNQPMLQRFRREAEAVAALRHAGIVPIYDIGESGGIAYIMMPLIKGETLKKRLDRDGRLPISEVRRIIKEIATALSVAHDAGLVHRDIKPENVMLEGPKQQILVMDFGIAKALDPDQTGMTSSGLIVGTPHFMSPEQASGEAVDARSDQYSLAVLGYRMVTGAHPFDGETTRALLYKQVFETPPPARDRFPDIPQSLSDALHRGMAKDPKDRYATIDDFASAVLQEDTNERPSLAGKPADKKVKAKPPEPARDKTKAAAKPDPKAAAPAGAKPAAGGRRIGFAAVAAVAAISAVAVFVMLRNRGAAAPTDLAQQPPAATDSTPAVTQAAPPPAPGQKAAPQGTTGSTRGGGTRTAETPATSTTTTPVQPPPAAAPTTCADAVRASAWPAAATQCANEADQGNVAAMMAMGGMSERGQGLSADPAVAATWYQKASAAGSAEAAYKLGEMYEEGRGVDKNLTEAANHYTQAARRGVTPAMRSLARMLAAGQGVQKNESGAVNWYRRAAAGNDIPSILRLAEFYTSGRGVSKNEGEAARLYQRAAELGDAEGRYQLAMMYFNGRGMAQSDSLGLVWLRRSASQGFEPAQAELAKRAP
jgi:serine/threonine-protein kinase